MISSDVIYNLTYPNALGDYKSQEEDYNFNNELNDNQKPIIVLFGWSGAEDKYLSIYSKIYEAKGFITLRCIIPLKTMFFWRSRISTSYKMLVDFLSNEFEDRLYVIHCFSTGGAFAYQHFVEAVKLNPKAIQDVESFAEHRKSLGIEVSMKMYEDSQHVKHYPPNKLSYTESVFLFVNKCFESSMV
ncbi:hypothetical protein WA026_008259 [Henosepilachna vigintioctopunctata]|uniref:Uncharacterized protein n=1 Tax=Henosepilachna vigintioctopunctata TaxID=420089 RepID=A0AAW1TPT8_9CUCU